MTATLPHFTGSPRQFVSVRTRMLDTVASFFSSLVVRLVVVSLAVISIGCAGDPAKPASKPTAQPVVLILGGQSFKTEIASTNHDRQLGLMYRKSLPADAAMVFVFAREQELTFWMKDTSIPLDIVYLDPLGKIVSIKQMAPFDLGPTTSDGLAKYAIELNQGTAAKLGLKPGDLVDLPTAVRQPAEVE